MEIFLSCCIWIYIRVLYFRLDLSQNTTTGFLEFAPSQFFSSLVARFPVIQAISLSTYSPRSPLVIPTHTKHSITQSFPSRNVHIKEAVCSIHDTSIHIILLASRHMKAASNRPYRLSYVPSRPTTCPSHQPTIASIPGGHDGTMILLLPTPPHFPIHSSDTHCQISSPIHKEFS